MFAEVEDLVVDIDDELLQRALSTKLLILDPVKGSLGSLRPKSAYHASNRCIMVKQSLHRVVVLINYHFRAWRLRNIRQLEVPSLLCIHALSTNVDIYI